jgi:hypothetical protein
MMGIAFATRARQSLGYDELFTVWVSARSFPDLIHQANLDGFTPPAFYGLVKLLSLAGLATEDLRVLPILLAGLAVFAGLRASEQLFGPDSRGPALLLIPGSAYLFTFAHELRPYSALLLCAFSFLGLLAGPATARKDGWVAAWALVATSLSYLGLAMVAFWVLECRSRRSKSQLVLVSLLALGLCALGILKAVRLAGASLDGGVPWSEARPVLSSIFFGLAPLSFPPWVETASLILLAFVLVMVASRRGLLPPLALPTRAFVVFTVAVMAVDALVPIGFAPRYFALPMSALLLLLVGGLARMGRPGLLAALLLFGVNALAIFRYSSVPPPAREDWRTAMGRIETRLGPSGVLLAFPFHHAAVAAHAYAPSLVLGGGYTSRNGPLFWYEPPASFQGYSFQGLEKMGDPGPVLRRLAEKADLCLLSDEPDAEKTRAVFAAFEALGETSPFDTGDSRLRARCRSRG